MEAASLLREFAVLVRDEFNAAGVSLLLCTEPADARDLLLVHDGRGEPLPELANSSTAEQLLAGAKTDNQGDAGPVTWRASSRSGGLLVRMTLREILSRTTASAREENERRSVPDIAPAPADDGTVWFGLDACDDSERFFDWLAGSGTDTGTWVSIGTRLAWSVYQLNEALQDPVSQLHDRIELQLFLNRAIAASEEQGQALSLLLVNPDDFNMVNHRYGREQGDLAIREIAATLTNRLRRTDGIFRYAGAIFALVLPATGREHCRRAVEKLRQHLTGTAYVDGQEHFTFSMGATTLTVEGLNENRPDAAKLLRSADAALNRARLSGGARAIMTEFPDGAEGGAGVSPLHGVFTTNTEKDYRNMLLLWETIGLVTQSSEPEAMAKALIDRLALGFQPDRIVLLNVDDGRVLASNVRDAAAVEGRSSGREVAISDRQQKLIDSSLDSRRTERLRDDAYTGYAVPLIARDTVIACMFLDARGRRLQLDSSDIVFLNALAGQMAVALDRARLATGWIHQKDQESRKLREELDELRQSLSPSRMIYDSEEMHGLMDTLKRVAPSDATVLITGESGTGKEMLAQALHQYSRRAESPFVIFDCGAVAPTLIEAELFGHVKGAFTGAENASDGRIAQAAGGTLFLDEIGELPLQVQAKLLRFVQEKSYAPVGSAVDRHVDVRIVAATNRTLADEVGAGRFRGDLYYRLQVISLQAIPLRHRRDDILPLARYYLERFSGQNGLAQRYLSDDAAQKLLAYDWPGNVRELQHSMLRTVLISDGEEIKPDAIQLLPEATIAPPVTTAPPTPATPTATPTATPATPVVQGDDPWAPLREELLRQIQRAMDANRDCPVPLGKWLTEDFVLAASDATDRVARRAAELVGLPESTFRRHLQKSEAEHAAGIANRTDAWRDVRPLVSRVVRNAQQTPAGADLVDRARATLLEHVIEEVEGRISVGAALMGVTPPTYKRWVQARASQGNA